MENDTDCDLERIGNTITCIRNLVKQISVRLDVFLFLQTTVTARARTDFYWISNRFRYSSESNLHTLTKFNHRQSVSERAEK